MCGFMCGFDNRNIDTVVVVVLYVTETRDRHSKAVSLLSSWTQAPGALYIYTLPQHFIQTAREAFTLSTLIVLAIAHYVHEESL